LLLIAASLQAQNSQNCSQHGKIPNYQESAFVVGTGDEAKAQSAKKDRVPVLTGTLFWILLVG